MRFIKTKEESLEENYLELHYDEIDEETATVLERLRPALKYIEGIADGKKLTVPLTDMYYFETVDRKTFVYTEKDCYETKLKLYETEERLCGSGFVRVSKSTLVNLKFVRSLKAELDRRLRLTLENGEQLIVSRQYADEIKVQLGVK